MAAKQVAGQADIVDVVNAVNTAEITLDTVVAVRDKVISAYQSHHADADLIRNTHQGATMTPADSIDFAR